MSLNSKMSHSDLNVRSECHSHSDSDRASFSSVVSPENLKNCVNSVASVESKKMSSMSSAESAESESAQKHRNS